MKKFMLTLAVLFTFGTAMTTFTSCRDTESTGGYLEGLGNPDDLDVIDGNSAGLCVPAQRKDTTLHAI